MTLARVTLFAAALLVSAQAAAATKLTWYGHAAFKIETAGGKVILIDPWIQNPSNPNGKADVEGIAKADLILITHGHFDHVGDAAAIAQRTGAQLVATFDLGKALVTHGGYPDKQFGFPTTGNFGGEIALLDGEVTVAFIPAVHSSTVASTDPAAGVHDGGNPGGMLIGIKGGPTFYHTGDTDVFGDMALIPRFRKVDVMLACIGDRFTMGPERAADAVKLVGPKTVIPMHFGTFPVLSGTAEAFGKALNARKLKTALRVMKPGETVEL